MRLAEFAVTDITNFDAKLFADIRVPDTWTGKSIAIFVFSIHDQLKNLNEYIQLYTDFVADNGKKYRISQPVNAERRPGNALRGLIDSTKKILLAIDKLGKSGKLSESGQDKILIKKMRSQFAEMADGLEDLVDKLTQNPPEFQHMTSQPIPGVSDKLAVFNTSFVVALKKLAQSLYAAAENL